MTGPEDPPAAGPPIFDHRRAFRGRAQLTAAERQVLDRLVEGEVLVSLFERTGRTFYIGGTKVRTATALRLIGRRYVRPRDGGLLPGDDMAQTYEAVLRAV